MNGNRSKRAGDRRGRVSFSPVLFFLPGSMVSIGQVLGRGVFIRCRHIKRSVEQGAWKESISSSNDHDSIV
jgi:hypothetical protein